MARAPSSMRELSMRDVDGGAKDSDFKRSHDTMDLCIDSVHIKQEDQSHKSTREGPPPQSRQPEPRALALPGFSFHGARSTEGPKAPVTGGGFSRPTGKPVPSRNKTNISTQNLQGYAQVISDDEEILDIPYSAPPSNTTPLVTSDCQGSQKTNQIPSSHFTDWPASDSVNSDDDDKDDDYTPDHPASELSLEEIYRPLDEATDFLRQIRSTPKKNERASRSRSKILTLNVPQQGVKRKTHDTLAANITPVPEFSKGKRIVSRHGYSQTPTAIDYRARKASEKDYEEKLRAAIDHDIVRLVEDEGWLTPVGRLCKAGVRMMERVQQEREVRMMERVNRERQEWEGRLLGGGYGVQRDRDGDARVGVVMELRRENRELRGVVERMRDVLKDV